MLFDLIGPDLFYRQCGLVHLNGFLSQSNSVLLKTKKIFD